jgi:hypothetical protein
MIRLINDPNERWISLNSCWGISHGRSVGRSVPFLRISYLEAGAATELCVWRSVHTVIAESVRLARRLPTHLYYPQAEMRQEAFLYNYIGHSLE